MTMRPVCARMICWPMPSGSRHARWRKQRFKIPSPSSADCGGGGGAKKMRRCNHFPLKVSGGGGFCGVNAPQEAANAPQSAANAPQAGADTALPYPYPPHILQVSTGDVKVRDYRI